MGPDLDARWAFARNAEALVGASGADLTEDVMALLQRINGQVIGGALTTLIRFCGVRFGRSGLSLVFPLVPLGVVF